MNPAAFQNGPVESEEEGYDLVSQAPPLFGGLGDNDELAVTQCPDTEPCSLCLVGQLDAYTERRDDGLDGFIEKHPVETRPTDSYHRGGERKHCLSQPISHPPRAIHGRALLDEEEFRLGRVFQHAIREPME